MRLARSGGRFAVGRNGVEESHGSFVVLTSLPVTTFSSGLRQVMADSNGRLLTPPETASCKGSHFPGQVLAQRVSPHLVPQLDKLDEGRMEWK